MSIDVDSNWCDGCEYLLPNGKCENDSNDFDFWCVKQKPCEHNEYRTLVMFSRTGLYACTDCGIMFSNTKKQLDFEDIQNLIIEYGDWRVMQFSEAVKRVFEVNQNG